MKKVSGYLLLALAGMTVFTYCSEPTPAPQQPAEPQPISQDSLVKRGAYLVTTMGCNDCHSPKVFGPMGMSLDTTRLLSGHPADMPLPKYDAATAKNWLLFGPFATVAVGPWGTTFAANLTSDSTGIGNWTEQQFFKALREGKYRGLDNTRPILPPMPWQGIAQATDEDLKAIFVYLKSTKPVKNVVPSAILAGPPPPAK